MSAHWTAAELARLHDDVGLIGDKALAAIEQLPATAFLASSAPTAAPPPTVKLDIPGNPGLRWSLARAVRRSQEAFPGGFATIVLPAIAGGYLTTRSSGIGLLFAAVVAMYSVVSIWDTLVRCELAARPVSAGVQVYGDLSGGRLGHRLRLAMALASALLVAGVCAVLSGALQQLGPLLLLPLVAAPVLSAVALLPAIANMAADGRSYRRALALGVTVGAKLCLGAGLLMLPVLLGAFVTIAGFATYKTWTSFNGVLAFGLALVLVSSFPASIFMVQVYRKATA